MADVRDVLWRLQHDHGFLLDFDTDPTTATAGYDLTAAQRDGLIGRGRSLRAAVEAAAVPRSVGAQARGRIAPDVQRDVAAREDFGPVDSLLFDPEPVDPAPVDPEPVDPEPVDPEPVDPEPVDPEPVDPEPVDPAPVDPAPVDPAPVDPAPVDPAPVHPTPLPFPLDPGWPPAPPPSPPVFPDLLPPPISGYRLIVKIWPLGTADPEIDDPVLRRDQALRAATAVRTAIGAARVDALVELMEQL